MLEKKKILHLFAQLNSELEKIDERGEICIVGGAVMCLVYNARAMTKDVDAIFEPTKILRKLATKLADEENLPPDWLNDAVKGYLQPNFLRNEVLLLSHLHVWAPEAQYMLAMKCISARWDTHDKSDVVFLIRHLKLKKPEQVFKLIEKYYPKNKIPPKTQFLIEEIFE